MKRARVVGLTLAVIGAGQAALALSPGEPSSELLLVLSGLLTANGVVMTWRPDWVDGTYSSGRLQRDAGMPWFLLGGVGVTIGLFALAIAVGSTIGT